MAILSENQKGSIEQLLTIVSKKITRLEDKIDEAEKSKDDEKAKRLDHILDISLCRFSTICNVLQILGYYVDCDIHTDVCKIINREVKK